MLIHLNFWTGLLGALLTLAVSAVVGLVMVGLIRQSLISSMKTTIECYRIELEQMRADMALLRAKVAKVEKDGRLKTAQLGMAIRIIEYFDQVVTVYVKRRAGLPAAFVAQMDDSIKKLAEFREKATLELESQEINQDFYDWLVARATLSGPELFGARTSGAPQEREQASHEPT